MLIRKEALANKYSTWDNYNYVIVVFMLLSAILGSTIFGTIQIVCEVVLFILLLNGILYIKLNFLDIILLTTFLLISLLSFFINDFIDFALNFKIYGLFVFTFIYFRKIYFYPIKLIKALHVINFLLIFHQFFTGHFIVQSAWFFGDYKGYANARPVGVFLVPHVSAFFLSIYIIYLIRVKRKYSKSSFYMILLLMVSSLTSTIALLGQLSQQLLNNIISKVNFAKKQLGWTIKLGVIFVPILFFTIYSDELLTYLKSQGGYTRYYTLEILMNQFFDSRFFEDIFDFVPRSYSKYLLEQEKTFADFGNEIGFVKVFVEGGFLLGLVTLISIVYRLKHFNVFLLITLMHYSFVIIMPFMLFLIMMYNHEVDLKESQLVLGCK